MIDDIRTHRLETETVSFHLRPGNGSPSLRIEYTQIGKAGFSFLDCRKHDVLCADEGIVGRYILHEGTTEERRDLFFPATYGQRMRMDAVAVTVDLRYLVGETVQVFARMVLATGEIIVATIVVVHHIEGVAVVGVPPMGNRLDSYGNAHRTHGVDSKVGIVLTKAELDVNQ